MKIASCCEHFHAPRCAGRACIGRLTEDVTVKLTFESTGIANHFDSVRIKLINRHEGEIDTLLIRLIDAWGKVRMHSTGEQITPHIWDNNDNVRWYGFTPTRDQYAALSEEVNVYLSAFAEPEQTETLDISL